MPALSTSRKTATLAALLITGGATTAIAQMVANADAQADAQRARAAAMAVCDTIRDDAERTGCRAARSIQFDEQRIAGSRCQHCEVKGRERRTSEGCCGTSEGC